MPATDTMLTAIATDLTTRWLPTYAWEEAKLQHRPPMATLYLDHLAPTVTDQASPLGIWARVDVIMRLYISFRQREKAAQTSLRNELDDLITVLTTDPTCGGAAQLIELAEDGISVRVDQDEQLLIAETTLEVEPWPTV